MGDGGRGGDVERGDVERGDVERGDVERGDVERGDVERGDVERGDTGALPLPHSQSVRFAPIISLHFLDTCPSLTLKVSDLPL